MNIEMLRDLLSDVLDVYEADKMIPVALGLRIDTAVDTLEKEIDDTITWNDIPAPYRVMFELKEGGRLYTRHAVNSCSPSDACVMRKGDATYSVPFGAVVHLINSKGKNR